MSAFGSPSKLARRSNPAPVLSEPICRRCLHNAFKDEPGTCTAQVNEENQTFVKCERCKAAHKCCVPILTTPVVVKRVNELLELRIAHALAMRDADEDEDVVPSAAQLRDMTLRVRSFVAAQARVVDRLGGTEKPSTLDVQPDIAKSLHTLNHTLINFLDVARLMVVHLRSLCVPEAFTAPKYSAAFAKANTEGHSSEAGTLTEQQGEQEAT